MKGVSALSRRKCSSVRSTPAERAMAMRWIVALVEPPVAITTRTAFSNAAWNQQGRVDESKVVWSDRWGRGGGCVPKGSAAAGPQCHPSFVALAIVMMSRGLMSCSMQCRSACAARRHSDSFSGCSESVAGSHACEVGAVETNQ